jgi:hypothetical protein
VDDLIRVAGKNTNTVFSRLILDPREAAATRLETYIEEERPAAVFLGSFIALDLQNLAERYGDIRFVCLDAPPTPPGNTPYIWVRFDPGPAFRSAGDAVRRYLATLSSGAGPGKTSPVVFLGTGFEDLYTSAFLPAFIGSSGDPVESAALDKTVFSRNESVEGARSKASEKIGKKPPLYILFAGTHNPLILSLIRETGPAPVVLHLRGRIADIPGLPFLGSLEKDYSAAVSAGLAANIEKGGVLDVPMRFQGE